MARKTKSTIDDKAAEVPLSSMIDVVFLLLIYFILTQKPVVEDVHLQVDLPAPGAPSKGDPPPLLTIDVMRLPGLDNGDQVWEMAKAETNAELRKQILAQEKTYYHMNGAPYEISKLEEYLKTVADTNPDTTVMINCGPNAKHKKLIKLLDICSKVGLNKLNIVDDDTVAFKADPPEKR